MHIAEHINPCLYTDMKPDLVPILDRLRAAGEPTRMRILALLRGRDLSVGELVQVLAQSQPRLSHHLKALTSAGLVERMPEGSFVFYRAATRGEGRAFLDSLFEQIAVDSPTLQRDSQQLEEVTALRAASAESFTFLALRFSISVSKSVKMLFLIPASFQFENGPQPM